MTMKGVRCVMAQICDRCKVSCWTTIMSMFNTETLCNKCLEEEKAHPKYQEARDEEVDALLKGNYNFPGIGLPEDLKRS
jgi:hypothetical protein